MNNPSESVSSDILIVDDTLENVQVLSQMLRDAGYRVFAAFSGEDALNLVARRTPDLILLDVMMPGMNGFEVCAKLKSNETIQPIPVIFLSALSDIESKVQAFESGGVDYITKPFQQQEVLARIDLHLSLRKLQIERESYIDRLKEKQQHLENLNKEKDEMMAIISHDMRNPLGGIIGVSEMMQSDPVDDPETTNEMLGLIQSSAERLLALVNDLLDVAIIETNSLRMQFTDESLLDLVNEVVELHKAASKNKGVSIKVTETGEQRSSSIDVPKFSQVIGNLVSNAIKFTPQGGNVDIIVDYKTDAVVMTVQDSGIGMSPEMIDNLFVKMGDHQRDGTSGEKGTGLGMPIVKRFVEEHGGSIIVHSEVDKGTRFEIILPSEKLKS